MVRFVKVAWLETKVCGFSGELGYQMGDCPVHERPPPFGVGNRGLGPGASAHPVGERVSTR